MWAEVVNCSHSHEVLNLPELILILTSGNFDHFSVGFLLSAMALPALDPGGQKICAPSVHMSGITLSSSQLLSFHTARFHIVLVPNKNENKILRHINCVNKY